MLDWDRFALPISRYLIDQDNQVQRGPIGANEAAAHGFYFRQLNDPELEEYRLADQQTGLTIYPGDERVGRWFRKQRPSTAQRPYQPLLDLRRACQTLEYQLESPDIKELIAGLQEQIMAKLADAIVPDREQFQKSPRIQKVLQEARELGIGIDRFELFGYVFRRLSDLFTHELD